MLRIVLDGNTISQLAKLDHVAELVDPSGKVIGRFVPALDMQGWEQITPDVSEAELDRREQANEKTYTTAEVIERLESL